MTDFPRRRFPCGECPWRRDTEPGQFPACRYDALAATSDQSGLTAPMFGCHKGEPGTNADLACAGWLAVAGTEHLAVRMAVELQLPMNPALAEMATGMKARIKRSNVSSPLLAVDAAILGGPRWGSLSDFLGGR